MGRSKQITPRKRAVILQYCKDGLKQSEICKRLDLSRSTVLQQFATTGSMDVKRRSGRLGGVFHVLGVDLSTLSDRVRL